MYCSFYQNVHWSPWQAFLPRYLSFGLTWHICRRAPVHTLHKKWFRWCQCGRGQMGREVWKSQHTSFWMTLRACMSPRWCKMAWQRTWALICPRIKCHIVSNASHSFSCFGMLQSNSYILRTLLCLTFDAGRWLWMFDSSQILICIHPSSTKAAPPPGTSSYQSSFTILIHWIGVHRFFCPVLTDCSLISFVPRTHPCGQPASCNLELHGDKPIPPCQFPFFPEAFWHVECCWDALLSFPNI